MTAGIGLGLEPPLSPPVVRGHEHGGANAFEREPLRSPDSSPGHSASGKRGAGS